ncbi:RDD family protein [Streptomyces sp. NPDC015131]|uniref:RDD family protein n=1 Tax=Streptomyces sp. NPDC015131 TaxID=3364941 RepID=UPI0036FBAF78
MSNEPPPPGQQPPEDDPFRKKPQDEGAQPPPAPPPPPPGGGGPYGGGTGGPYGGGTGGPYGGDGPGGPGGPYGSGPYPGGPYGGGPYGGADPLAGMPPLADPGRRVLARIIDWIIVAIPLALIAIPFNIYDRVTDQGDWEDVWTTSDGNGWVFQLLTIIAYIGYDALMVAKNRGQTLGMRLMGMRVAMLNDGSVPPMNASLIRSVVLWLPGLICCACLWPLLLLILILVDKPYKQGLHDKAAKTVVVSTTQ